MKFSRLKTLITATIVAALVVGGYLTRDHWLPLLRPNHAAEPVEAVGGTNDPTGKVIVNEQSQANLGLKAKPLKVEAFWKTIPVPGMIVDRPGQSDRNITAPLTGVVVKIAKFPGDTVQPGDPLFTLRVLSEAVHLTQADLFKTTQDIALAQAQRKRLVASGGAIPESRVIEMDSQISRLETSVKANRQELLSRGFGTEQIDGVAEGKYVLEIAIVAPPRSSDSKRPADSLVGQAEPPPIEVQELKIELGQQVQAGQTLCLLANHQKLAVEGRAFRDETPLLEKSVKERWPVEVDFQEDPSAGWGEQNQMFHIRQMANTIDPQTRTFAFLMPLENQSRVVEDDGRKLILWRFRPGQKVRLMVRVEKMENVFVVPADAVTHDGGEAFVFTQNVNTFERKPVRILLQDRQCVVLANDKSLTVGDYVVQSGAALLNRMVKAGSSGVPKGFHIHADGSLHKNEDEGK